MGSLSIWHLLIVMAVFLLMFGGKGRVSGVMGDLAQGIKAFKRGLNEDSVTPSPAQLPPSSSLPQPPAQ